MGHTPGPWFVRESDGDHHTEVYAEKTGAVCYPEPDDAYLIAAAPELLLALRRLLAMWEREFGPSKGRPDPGGAYLAIAKAEGRSE